MNISNPSLPLNVTINPQGLNRHVSFSISAHVMEKGIEDKFQEIARRTNIPGFRPGKVPLNLLKQRYEKGATLEVLEELAKENVKSILKENQWEPFGQPRLTLGTYEEGQDIQCTIDLELMPHFEIPEFNTLKIINFKVEINDQDIEKQLEYAFKQGFPILEDRPFQHGDKPLVDMDLWVNGKNVAVSDEEIDALVNQERSQEYRDHLEAELEKVFLGKMVGDSVFLTLPLPEILKKKYASQEVQYKATLTKILSKTILITDDASAEKFGFKSFKNFQETLKESLESRIQRQVFLCRKRHVLDTLEKIVDFEVPRSVLENEFKIIWENYEAESHTHKKAAPHHDGTHQHKEDSHHDGGEDTQDTQDAHGTHAAHTKDSCDHCNHPPEDLSKKEEECRALALRRVRLGFLLGEIGRREKFRVSQRMLDNAIFKRALMFPYEQMKAVVDFHRRSPNVLKELEAKIFEDLVIEHILTKAQEDMNPISLDNFKVIAQTIVEDDF